MAKPFAVCAFCIISAAVGAAGDHYQSRRQHMGIAAAYAPASKYKVFWAWIFADLKIR